MSNKNIYINKLEEKINISPNSSKNLDEMYNSQVMLSYSESKSQSLKISKNTDNTYIINNNNQSLKNILINKQEEKGENINNNINNELSSLQISISNLLSDRESKEIIFNKKSNNNSKIIDISYDISNNDNESDINSNMNNKKRKIQYDEQSSLCNYAKSLYNNKYVCTSPNKRKKVYQIEKGEDVNISLQKKSINNKTKRIFKNNDTMDFDSYYRNNNLSINKVNNFTINNISQYNQNYNLSEDNYLSDNKRTKTQMIKNKVKLINYKNIDINKVDSKNFFYNPKTLNANKNINSNMKKIYKTIEYPGTNKKLKLNINKIISNTTKIKSDFKNKKIVYKKLILNNNNNSNNKTYNSNNSNISFIKKKKLFYLNQNKSKNKNEKNISFSNFNKTELSINNKNILSNVLMNKIKTEQKKTTKKLISKINNMNNLSKTNRTNFLPIFNKIFEKKINSNKSDKQVNNNQEENKSKEKKNEDKNQIKKKENKNNCNKIIVNNNSHKKINTQINIVSLLSNFNKEKNNNKKKNKSIYNFGNIYFINQNQYQIHKKNESEINLKNNINIRNKLEIINNFSNYRKKSKNDNSNTIKKSKRFNTETDLTSIKNKLNYNLK